MVLYIAAILYYIICVGYGGGCVPDLPIQKPTWNVILCAHLWCAFTCEPAYTPVYVSALAYNVYVCVPQSIHSFWSKAPRSHNNFWYYCWP